MLTGCWRCLVLMLLVALSGAVLCGQAELRDTEKDDLWLSVRDVMRARVENLGAYTCIQNITRFETPQNRKDERLVDTVRMQVTAVDGDEYYSWPASPNAVENPSDLLRTGLMGTGLFQGYAHSLFFSPGPGQLEFIGRDASEGIPLLHFRFAFDSLRERLSMNVGGGRATVAAKGEFWAEERGRTMRRLRIQSAEAAPEINVRAVEYLFDWAPVRIHGEEMLLPQTASVRIDLFTGEVRRNEITLSQCREFSADSSVRFDAAPEDESVRAPEDVSARAGAALPAAAGFLPEGVNVPLRLLSAIDGKVAAVGDVFEVEVARDVNFKGQALLRKGDRAEGRIRHLARYREPETHTVLWLEISVVRSGDKEYIFLGELDRRNPLANLISRAEGFTEGRIQARGDFGGYRVNQREYRTYAAVPGVASFLFRGDQAVLPAGYGMDWKTLPPRTDRGQ